MFKRMIYLGVTVIFVTVLPSLTGLADPLAPAMAQGLLLDELHRMMPLDGNDTRAIALGDVDGDGDLDAFIGSDYSIYHPDSANRLYLNDGTGVFLDATHQIPNDDDDTLAVALGDVDGDGDLDAFLGNYHQNRLYLNDGKGVFTKANDQLPHDDDCASAIALGDVDGDGDLDAFIGNAGYYAEADCLYLNDGAGDFNKAPPGHIPNHIEDTGDVALGDVDGDGDLDVLVGNTGRYGEQTRLYLNDGAGFFTDATNQIPYDHDETNTVALGDVDGDGDLDAYLGNAGQNRLYLNDGAGFFTDATAQIPFDEDRALDVAFGDVDGDGDLDAFVANITTAWHSEQNRLYLNDGSGGFSDATNQIPIIDDTSRDVALADVDGDGDLDVMLGIYYRTNRLYLNDGAGFFSDHTFQVPRNYLYPTAMALNDVDGDGDLDAFIASDEKDRLLLNDGTGLFYDASNQIPYYGKRSYAVALGDVDGDGDLDAFLGLGSCEQNHLYLNDGAGFFTDATNQIPADYDSTYAVSLGDVDGDGDLDIFIGNTGAQNRLYLNDGSGFFSDATMQVPSDADITYSAALVDVDGDGDLDAFVGNDGQNRLYVNDGTGVFLDATHQIPNDDDDTRAVALGDVDGDGDLDAILGNGYPYYQDRLYLNDGAGVFSDATNQIPIDDDYVYAVALGDLDGDGDLDVLIGNSGEKNRLYLNDGAGFFTDAPSRIPIDDDYVYAVALGDLDGDGDIDAFIGNEKQSRIYANLTRQLAWRAIPRIGKPLAMDLYGPANGSYVLAASRAMDNVPMPPYGILRIDLGQVFYQGKGGLDSEGRASVDFDVPANPSLVGMSFYFQALVGPPDKLTNLEIATITNL